MSDDVILARTRFELFRAISRAVEQEAKRPPPLLLIERRLLEA